MSQDKINATMKALAEYIRMKEDIDAMIESCKDELKAHMQAAGLDTLQGSEHKATFKCVTSSRLDTSTLKKELPDVAARYTITTTAARFTFN